MLMAEVSVAVSLHPLPVLLQNRKCVLPLQLNRLVTCDRLFQSRPLKPLSVHRCTFCISDIFQENHQGSPQADKQERHRVEDYTASSLGRTADVDQEEVQKVVPSHLEAASSLKCQLLRKFPTKQLKGKVVLVRCDLNLSFKDGRIVAEEVITSAIPTLLYLSKIGCKVVIASHWNSSGTAQNTMETSLVADALSRSLKQVVLWEDAVVGEGVEKRITSLYNGNILLLQNLKLYKEEDGNDAVFSKALTAKVDHLVNDAFRVSHRVLASTVGAASYTCARLAGFQFAKELSFMRKIRESRIHPFVAIIGGTQLSAKVEVLQQLLSKCDKLFITGPMVFTMLEAAGFQAPSLYVEQDMVTAAKELLQYASEKKIDVVLPKDFMLETKSSSHPTIDISIPCPVPDGWQVVDLGADSYNDMVTAVKDSKMVLWLGPCAIRSRLSSRNRMLLLAEAIGHQSLYGCLTIAGGKEVVEALTQAGAIETVSHVSHTCAAFWQLLKGYTLPGVAALDPVKIRCKLSPPPPDWKTVFEDPSLPLTIDIGCGNGLFILKLAQQCQMRNFLGLEVFQKLVDRCIESAMAAQLSNTHFMAANATSSLESIVESYPGKVALVTIQCPDPNFSRPSSRWRMVQRQLVEAVTWILCPGGKVFLQSDVKVVLEAMLHEFEVHAGGKCKLSCEHSSPSNCDEYGWLKFNPLEASTDWEDHALERGGKMYRVLLQKHR